MRTENLASFLAVQRHLNYTHAARELHLSQPAVWRQIRQLEQELGVPLFEQIGKRLHITDAGRTLAREAESLIGRLSRLEESVRAHAGGVHGRIRIGASTTPGFYLLPRILGMFHKAHSDVELDFRIDNSASIQHRLIRNELDLGFLGNDVTTEELQAETWIEDEIVCFSAPTHPLASQGSLASRDLLSEMCVMREEGSATRRLFEAWLQAHAGKIERMLVIRCPEAVKKVVAAGLGFSFLSRHGIRDEVARDELRLLDVTGLSLSRRVEVAWHPDKHFSPAMGAFLEMCRNDAPKACR
jgi:DNA-binding transcriptional LysR family regulator